MDVTPLVKKGQMIIQSYSGGGFKVSGVRHDGAVLVFPDRVEPWSSAPDKAADVSLSSFQDLIDQAQDIDVVLFGTGERAALLMPDLRKALQAKGLMVEAMATGAACRTYNVLIAEGRRVVAALIAV